MKRLLILAVAVVVTTLILGIIYWKQIIPVKEPVHNDIEYTSLQYRDDDKVIYFLNENGETVYEFYHDEVTKYDDYFKVCYVEKCGLLDLELNEIIPEKYDRISVNEFYGEVYITGTRKNLTYLFDLDGNVYNDEGYDSLSFWPISSFETILQNSDFANREEFLDRVYVMLVAEVDGKFGIVGSKGNILLPIDYSYIKIFNSSEFYFTVEKEDKVGILSVDNEILLPIEYDRIIFGVIEGVNDKYGYVNRSVTKVIEPTYDFVSSLRYGSENEQFLAVTQNGKVGVIDLDENLIIPFEYDLLDELFDYLYVCNEEHCGVIDIDNTIILPLEYDSIDDSQDYYLVEKDGKMGVLHQNTEEVIPLVYDTVELYYDMILVELNGLWGVIDYENNILLPITNNMVEKSYRATKIGLEVEVTNNEVSEYITLGINQ